MEKWIDEAQLHAGAVEASGLTDFGHPHYLDGLRAFVESAVRDANLNAAGRLNACGLVALFLRNRLLLAEERKRRPEVFERPLVPPIIVFGLPRTGTTLLHRMLALDPAHSAVPLWELLRPIPYETPDRRREIALEGDREQEAARRDYDRVHYTRADTPEECVILLATTFCSALFSAFLPVYGYAAWGLMADKSQVYSEYRDLLQSLQAVRPGLRLVMKTPAHMAALPELVAAIPDAMLVQTHRDPVPACVSAMSNCRALQSPFVEALDVPRMVEEIVHSLATSAERSIAFRRDHPGRICDVQYDQLAASPIATVRSIYARFNLPWSDEYEERLDAYVRDNPQTKHGRHTYDATEFGVAEAQIADRFAEYRECFGFMGDMTRTA
jgi:hypothetical protein